MRPVLLMLAGAAWLPVWAGAMVAAQETQPVHNAGEPDPQRAQVEAARADAINRLYADIGANPISARMTVLQLVERLGGESALRQVLRQAEQIGGTRWVDDQTPQVRVEIDGPVIVDTLEQLARAHPHDLPPNLTPEQLELKLAPFKSRTFAATGTSTAQGSAAHLKPGPADRAWAGVSDQDRRAAIAVARADCVARVLDSVSRIETAKGKTVAAAMATPAVEQALRAWLQSRPVTSVDFRDDLEVRIALAASPDDFFAVLADAIKHDSAGAAAPADEAGWNRLHQQIVARMAPAIGRGMAGGATTGAAGNRAASLVPADPPGWVSDTLDAEAVAKSAGRLLHTARVAESVADERLRARLDGLMLSAGVTLGDAAKQDPALAEALQRSMRRAHVYKVDYNDPAPGSVRVRVTISLEDVWRELNSR